MKPTRPRRSLSRSARPLRGARRSPRSRDRHLLPEASWSHLAASLLPPGASEAENRRARGAAEGMLWALRRSAGWDTVSETAASAASTIDLWRLWLADGTWVRFWGAYVQRLDVRGRRAWLRALERAGTRLPAAGSNSREADQRRAWWLVSLAILKVELDSAG